MVAKRQVREKLQFLPEKPGVYLMRDQAGQVIYVGKAISLKNRVRSYFNSSQSRSPKVKVLVEHVSDFEYIVTDSEVEALILECNLIKKYRPRYNVNLKDDKSYPYLKVTLQEEFPRLVITRNMVKDGAKYYGPYTNVGALHDTVAFLRKIFRLRTCKERELSNRARPCLNYHINRCYAPCMNKITPEAYGEMIREVCLFLDGRQDDLVRRLRGRMEAAAARLEFELAASLRDQLQAVEQVVARQKMVLSNVEDQDLIALARAHGEVCVQVFFVRQGKVVGREHFFLEGIEDLSRAELMAAFLKRYYDQVPFIPREILLGEETDEAAVIEAWLAHKRGGRVYLRVPRRGEKLRLLEMVAKNALLVLQEKQAGVKQAENQTRAALEELAAYLDLETPPERIECYDISNIQGTLAVGSMVVFTNGVADKQEYRRFRIKTVSGPDDYAMLREVFYRRFSKYRPGEQEGNGQPEGSGRIPDLIIVDGGKGQLAAVREVLVHLGLDYIPVFGLAKEFEEVFAPEKPDSIMLPRDAAALYLLQRLRDEAHRFAIEYHRRLRSKQLSRSILDEIPGIGPRRKKILLNHFGSIDAIAQASLEELATLPGMNRRVAGEVLSFIKNCGREGTIN